MAEDPEVQEALSALEDAEHTGWEPIILRDDVQAWRKVSKENPALYEYKAKGRYTSLSPAELLLCHIDAGYRTAWDPYCLEVTPVDKQGDKEVMYWVVKYPWPLTNRDYVYYRRIFIDRAANRIVLVTRTMIHPKHPEKEGCVRVLSFFSLWVVYPETTFEEKGARYEMLLFDDPRGNIPTSVLNWVFQAAVPQMISTVEKAALAHKDSPQRTMTFADALRLYGTDTRAPAAEAATAPSS
eukprot:RCo032381